MKTPRFLVALTVINLGLLGFQLLRSTGPVEAADVPPVLRGRSLEIVDDQGRVRASIKLQPAETFKPTGRKYPETVVLRLIDANGRPEVKVAASQEGGGLSLVGDSDGTQLLLKAEGGESSVKLKNNDGRQQVLKP